MNIIKKYFHNRKINRVIISRKETQCGLMTKIRECVERNAETKNLIEYENYCNEIKSYHKEINYQSIMIEKLEQRLI